MLDIDTCRSYATEANLVKALVKLGFHEEGGQNRYLVVCNRQGRFTPVFPFSNIQDGNALRYASHGFMTLG